jgi:orotidine-5'-phosphate decarboxylase
MDESFGRRLQGAVRRTGPLCAGIDPSATLLAAWGLPDDASGVERFGRRCVEGFAGVLPVVKPQVAFFERHGSAGLAALEQVIAAAHDAGLLVLADAKRGDIDSTCWAYADAWLRDGAPLAVDALTVHPYLGLGALAPMFEVARCYGRGVFVVVRSSNPEGRSLQEARTTEGPRVEDALLAGIAALNAAEVADRHAAVLADLGGVADRSPGVGADGGTPLGSVGAVVGATLERSSFDLSTLGGPVLAPGLGAQGASPADVAVRFAGCAAGTVLPTASRALLAEGPAPAALRRAARRLLDEVLATA